MILEWFFTGDLINFLLCHYTRWSKLPPGSLTARTRLDV